MEISFETAAWLNNKLIFPVWNYDAVFSYDFENKKLENFEKYNLLEYNNGPKYGSIQITDNQLILCPLYSDEVLILNFYSGISKKIKLKLLELPKDLFFDSCIYNNNIYLFPGTYSAIVKINLKTYDVQYFDDVVNKIRMSTDGNIIRHGIVQVENTAYFACTYINKLVKFNLETGLGELLDVNIDNNLSSVSESDDKNEIYILTICGDVYIYNLISGKSKLLCKGIGVTEKVAYSEIQYDKNNNIVVIFPFAEKNIRLYDINNKENYIISCGGETFWTSQHNGEIYAYIHSQNKLIIMDTLNKCIKEEVDLNDDCVKMEEARKFKLKHKIFNAGCYQELESNSLEAYIKYIV